MKIIKNALGYFSKSELVLWSSSLLFIIISFMLFDRENYLTLAASAVGATSLIFCAKGNPIGQILMIIFSVMYGIISYTFAYYGEMITYLGMTAPMAVFAFISWIKNPYNGNKSEVEINNLKKSEIIFMIFLALIVTLGFYFILDIFNTSNLILSTVSVTTSFIAVYLTFRRSEYYAIAYAANDVVLIFLWILAAFSDTSYISVIICFIMFLVNDLYGFINWSRIRSRQQKNISLYNVEA